VNSFVVTVDAFVIDLVASSLHSSEIVCMCCSKGISNGFSTGQSNIIMSINHVKNLFMQIVLYI